MAGPNEISLFTGYIYNDRCIQMNYIYSQVVPDPSSWQNTPATITNVTTTEYILVVWTKHTTVGTNLGIMSLLSWLGKLLVLFFRSLTVCILKRPTWVSTFLQFNTRVRRWYYETTPIMGWYWCTVIHIKLWLKFWGTFWLALTIVLLKNLGYDW